MTTILIVTTLIVLCFWLKKHDYFSKPIKEIGSIKDTAKKDIKYDDITVGMLFKAICYIVTLVVYWPVAVLIFLCLDLRHVLNYINKKDGGKEPEHEDKKVVIISGEHKGEEGIMLGSDGQVVVVEVRFKSGSKAVLSFKPEEVR